MIFRYDSLSNHFQTNFALMQHHKYSLNELNDMMPWERNVYVTMLLQFIEEENEKLKQQQLARKSRK
jgi:hypothetical protein